MPPLITVSTSRTCQENFRWGVGFLVGEGITSRLYWSPFQQLMPKVTFSWLLLGELISSVLVIGIPLVAARYLRGAYPDLACGLRAEALVLALPIQMTFFLLFIAP